MTTQRELFPAPEIPSWQGGVPAGEQLKREGQSRAAAKRADDLRHARVVARCIAENNGGLCHADLVADAMEKGGRASLGNAAGVLFQTDDWTWTGEFVKSDRPHAHQNLLRVWRLKG